MAEPAPAIAPEPSYSGPCDHYRPLIEGYDWPTETMLAIAQAESGCDPTARNTANSDGSTDTGLLQINSIHGIDAATLLDPAVNIQAAYRIYQSQGINAWSVYNNGKYKEYLR